MFTDRFRSLIFTIPRNNFAASDELKFPRTATEKVLSTYRVNNRVQIWNALLVAFCLSVAHLIAFMDIKEMLYDHSFDLDAVIMA